MSDSDWYKENLCVYDHPKARCRGVDNKDRRRCKFFPMTLDYCPDFNVHNVGDCNCISAYFEACILSEKP